MTDREAFIAAIVANPADDTPRLVFADWLEERGEAARAGFIRDQIRLAHVRPGSEEYRQLFRKTAETLKANLPAWIQDACDAFGQPAAWKPEKKRGRWLNLEIDGTTPRVYSTVVTVLSHASFERGFLAWSRLYINCIQEPNTLAKLLTKHPITRLDFRFRTLSPKDWVKVAHPALHQIRTLRVSTNSANQNLGVLFATDVWQNLQAIEFNDASTATLKTLSDSLVAKQLRSLKLPIDSSLLAMNDFPLNDSLQELSLTSGRLESTVWAQLNSLPFRPTLKRLVLANLNMGDSGLAAFARGEVWVRLRSLVLDHNDITDLGWRDFVRGRRTPDLRMLSAAHNRISNDGATRLAQSQLIEKLEYLDLRHNRISGKGALALVRVLVESPLKKLLLTGNPINKTDADVIRKLLGSRVD